MATYTDDFNRANSSAIGNWTEVDDDWSINGNQLAPGISSTAYVIYNSPVDTSDQYAEVVLATASASSMGVFARSDVGGNNFYLWRNDGSEWTLFYNFGGNFTSIGSYVVPAVDGDVARIQCEGSTIKGFVNGVERVSVTDTVIPTGLYGGIRSAPGSTTRYDNFVVSDLGAPVPADTGAFFTFLN